MFSFGMKHLVYHVWFATKVRMKDEIFTFNLRLVVKLKMHTSILGD